MALILDLDDTLYLERDYVRSGFRAVGQYLASRFGIGGFGEQCWALFEQGVRGTTFDQVLRDTGLGELIRPAELIKIYREHVPSIELQDDVILFLEKWPRDRPIGLITDGPVSSQSAKIDALKLTNRMRPIVMSDSFGVLYRKPHHRPFVEVERLLKLPPTQLTYVGDNPSKDFAAPHLRGWRTIRIRRPSGEHSERPNGIDCPADAEITSFQDLTW